MADIPSAAQALYPSLPSGAPAAERTPPAADRSAAQSVYGSPEGGQARAREVIAGGVAKPAAAAAAGASDQTPQKPADWLADLAKDRAPGPDVAEPVAAEISAPGHLVEQFHELSREAGLSEAGSEQMLRLHQEALAETSTKFWTEQSSQWQRETRADREIGGRNLSNVVATVKPLLANKALTDPAFVDILQRYQLGNNPAVVRTLFRYAQALRGSGRR